MRRWLRHGLCARLPVRRPVLSPTRSSLRQLVATVVRPVNMGRRGKKSKGRRQQDDWDEPKAAAAARATGIAGVNASHAAGSAPAQPLTGTESAVQVVVETNDCGNRLDAVLALKLKFVPPLTRARVQRAVKAGCVRVNGKVATKASLKMRLGDTVLWDDETESEMAASRSSQGMVEPEPYPLHIYLEDDDLILLEKPAGMTVHPAGSLRSGTLVNALLHHTGCGAIQQGEPEPDFENEPEAQRQPAGGRLFVGDVVDVQTARGLEHGARVLGPSASGDEVRLEFSDGVVHDWDLCSCVPADDPSAGPEQGAPLLNEPQPEPEPLLDLLVRSDTSLAASVSARSHRVEKLGATGDHNHHQLQQLSTGGKLSDSERSGGIVRPGIVHRLDRGTTGVMVVAKNQASHAHLSTQFERRATRRLYLAIVWGVPLQAAGRIETHLGRDPGDRLRQAVRPPGKTTRYAATNYTVLASLDDGNLSVLRFALETGRTHQVSRIKHRYAFACLLTARVGCFGRFVCIPSTSATRSSGMNCTTGRESVQARKTRNVNGFTTTFLPTFCHGQRCTQQASR